MAPSSAPAQQEVRRVADDNPPVIAARDVVVRYGGVTAVAGTSLTVGRGEAVGLVGPNGAGKSTMLGAICGQVPISSGTVEINGTDVTDRPPYARARSGLSRTFQTTSEFDGLTVYENLLTAGLGREGASFWNGVAKRRFERTELVESARNYAWEMLARFEMTNHANAYAGTLSGGQRRLVEIMRCLMTRPSILLLDEPAVGVAPHLVRTLIGQLVNATSELGAALLLVEHALDVVRDSCERVVVMSDGTVIADAPYGAILENEQVRDAYLGTRHRAHGGDPT